MKRFNAHIGATNAALQETPEVLQSVCVNTSVNVLDSVIYNLVRIISGQTIVGTERIGVESRASFDVLANFGLQSVFLPVRYDRGANLPAAFQNSHDSGFVLRASTSDAAFTFAHVHRSEERRVGK